MRLIRKIIRFFILNFYFNICWGSQLASDFSASGSQEVNPEIVDPQEELSKNIIKGIEVSKDLNIFVLNVGQGNFVILRYNGNLVVIDAGTIAKPNTDVPRNSFMDYYLDHSDVLGGIIKEAKLKAVIITHPDADHYNYIPGFIDLLKGSGTQDNFSECVFFVAKNVPNNYSCLKSNELIKGNIENAIVITKENFENESLKLKKLLFNEEKIIIFPF